MLIEFNKQMFINMLPAYLFYENKFQIKVPRKMKFCIDEIAEVMYILLTIQFLKKKSRSWSTSYGMERC